MNQLLMLIQTLINAYQLAQVKYEETHLQLLTYEAAVSKLSDVLQQKQQQQQQKQQQQHYPE